VFVTVIHRIHDPEGFKAAEARALQTGLPNGTTLSVHAVTRDRRLGIGVWEGESVIAVRDVVEGSVGPFADSEYYEMEVEGIVT
jgi:hypothetical protein